MRTNNTDHSLNDENRNIFPLKKWLKNDYKNSNARFKEQWFI